MGLIPKLLKERHSTRAFLPKPVPEDLVRSILEDAIQSASGGNLQPLSVYALAGDAKQSVTDAVKAQIEEGKTEDEPLIQVYPEQLKSPYRDRRFECGMALYKALNIGRDDKDKRREQWQENYNFFGAPVGILIAIDEQMIASQYIDIGIYLQSLMLLAQEAGLNTCPQLSWSSWPQTCAAELNIPKEEHVVVGLAVGYGDDSASVNQYRTDRATLEEMATLAGFNS